MKTSIFAFALLLIMAVLAACDQTPAGTSATKQAVEAPSAPGYTQQPVVSMSLFVIDSSYESSRVDAGAARSRLEIEAADAWRRIMSLTSNDGFEIMSYGSPTTQSLFGEFRRADYSGKAAAWTFLHGLAPQGASPQYTALYRAMRRAPVSLTWLYFYEASAPGADPMAPGGTATYANILADSPGWWLASAETDADFGAIYVGNPADPRASFMQQLAACMGGAYVEL